MNSEPPFLGLVEKLRVAITLLKRTSGEQDAESENDLGKVMLA